MASRNVALNASQIAAAVSTVAGAVVGLGIIPQATGDAVVSAVPSVVTAVGVIVAAVHLLVGSFIHARVTPVADPKDENGEVLVPASVAAQAVWAATQPVPTTLTTPLADGSAE